MLKHQTHCVLVCARVLTLSGSNCFFTCLLDWYIFLPSGVIFSTNEKNIIDLKTYTQWSYCPCILILNLFNYILHVINSLLPSHLTHQLSLCTDSLAIHRHIQQPVLEGWEEDHQCTTIYLLVSSGMLLNDTLHHRYESKGRDQRTSTTPTRHPCTERERRYKGLK